MEDMDCYSKAAMERAMKIQEVRLRYFDLNLRHLHEKLCEEHPIQLSYTWGEEGAARRGASQART